MKITVQPAIEPISVSEAKAWLKVDWDSEDALIETLISAAREKCEQYTNRAFIEQTITETFGANDDVVLSRGDVITIDSVMVGDESIAPVDYGTYEDATGQVILLSELPDERVEVVYTAGYGPAADDVPRAVKAAIFLMVAEMYDNRGDRVKQLPTSSENLLNTVRRWVT